jgi:hypothetical protein
MRADEEVRQRRRLGAAQAPIRLKRLGAQEGGVVGQISRDKLQLGPTRVDFSRNGEAGGRLCIDDGVNMQVPRLSGGFKRLERPVAPFPGFGDSVDDDVRVYQERA